MTPEFIKVINKALALVAIAAGGFGMLLCVPYLLGSNVLIFMAVGIVFLSGAVLFGAGSVSMSLLVRDAR